MLLLETIKFGRPAFKSPPLNIISLTFMAIILSFMRNLLMIEQVTRKYNKIGSCKRKCVYVLYNRIVQLKSLFYKAANTNKASRACNPINQFRVVKFNIALIKHSSDPVSIYECKAVIYILIGNPRIVGRLFATRTGKVDSLGCRVGVVNLFE